MTSRYPTEAYDAMARLYDDVDARVQVLSDRGPAAETVRGQRTVFAALANEDRIRLLELLRDGECCACELQVALDAPQSTVATHLRKLREAGLVTSRRQGKWVYYRITDTATLELLDLARSLAATRRADA